MGVLAKKGELKEFIKNSFDSTKEIREQLNEAFQDWKKSTDEFTKLNADMSLDEIKAAFGNFFEDSFDTATDAASETIQTLKQTFHKSATVMRSTLKDWEALGNELMEETLEDLNEFFDDLHENSDSDDEESTKETVVTESGDEPVTVDVKIDVSVDFQKPKNGTKTEEKPKESGMNYEHCMEEIIKDGGLNLHAKEGNIDDFSVSCKSEECKRCLLWLYVLSQKNYQQMEREKANAKTPFA